MHAAARKQRVSSEVEHVRKFEDKEVSDGHDNQHHGDQRDCDFPHDVPACHDGDHHSGQRDEGPPDDALVDTRDDDQEKGSCGSGEGRAGVIGKRRGRKLAGTDWGIASGVPTTPEDMRRVRSQVRVARTALRRPHRAPDAEKRLQTLLDKTEAGAEAAQGRGGVGAKSSAAKKPRGEAAAATVAKIEAAAAAAEAAAVKAETAAAKRRAKATKLKEMLTKLKAKASIS